MHEHNVDREYLSGLTDDQLKALMPEQAAHFFTRHPPLLDAHRQRLLGAPDIDKLVRAYFETITPDQMYMAVIEMGAITPMLLNIVYMNQTIQKVKAASKSTEINRFAHYGINIHLSKVEFELLLRALNDQHKIILSNEKKYGAHLEDDPENEALAHQLSTIEHEHKLNHAVEEKLLDQLARVCPSLINGA